MTLRIALCISGQPRSYEKAYEYYKRNLFDVYPEQVKVFAHHWDFPGHSLSPFNIYGTDHGLVEQPFNESVKDAYNKRFTNTPNAEKWPPSSTVSAFRSVYMANFLRVQEELKSGAFDWVIRTRWDYALNTVIPFKELDPNKLYIPDCRQTPERDFGNDQFAFGNSTVMTAYSSTYLWLNTLYNAGVPMIGEDMLSGNLKMYGLVGENLVYYPMNNPFPPGPYNGTWHSLIRDDMEQWKD